MRASTASPRSAAFWRSPPAMPADRSRFPTLLHRHAFRQIPRLVHIAATADGNMIRQQLERHDLQDRQQQVVSGSNADHVIGHLWNLFVALASDCDHDALASLHFLNVRESLLVNGLA